MVTETELFESIDTFLIAGLKEVRVYKKKVGTRDELFAHILDAAARIKKREDQLRRIKRNLPHELQSALRLTVWEYRTFIVIYKKNCHFFCVQFLILKKMKIKSN